MEEWVGKIWHRWITGRAERRYPDAAVTLDQVRRPVGMLFRAAGGDAGLRIEVAEATASGARRSWVQRVAGTGERVPLAWRDSRALHLPATLDRFPQRQLNRDLYLWLAALAAEDGLGQPDDWFGYNQWLTCKALKRFPGLRPRYAALVEAQLALRPDPAALPDDEARQERCICNALQSPGGERRLPAAAGPPQPVYLWLHPDPPAPPPAEKPPAADADTPTSPGGARLPQQQRRRRAKRAEMPKRDRGLILDRFENIFSWAEHANVDRSTDEDDDPDAAEKAAEDLDVLSVARDSRPALSRIRFDLDLPAAANDDLPLGGGILLPEWDYRSSSLRPDYCRIQPMLAADAQPCELPQRLRVTARRLRGQFEALMPARVWLRGQPDGAELDLEACLARHVERRRGHGDGAAGLYRDFRGGARDLACLLLADLSLSTDAWVNNHARVIDVIRDSLFLFSEALSAVGDSVAMYGFSSRRRDHVRLHVIKEFQQPYGAVVRGRIQALKPGFYTRMGAAIRYGSEILARESAGRRLLLLLTDGKPNDLDQYESRYGIEDTRMALREARQQGLQPFCVTVDRDAGDYLPHLFGASGYVVIRRPSELPRQLPALYARLTG